MSVCVLCKLKVALNTTPTISGQIIPLWELDNNIHYLQS